jgi:hypothetical protein
MVLKQNDKFKRSNGQLQVLGTQGWLGRDNNKKNKG